MGQLDNTPAARASMVKSESLQRAPPHPLTIHPGLGAEQAAAPAIPCSFRGENTATPLWASLAACAATLRQNAVFPIDGTGGDDHQVRALEPGSHARPSLRIRWARR